jgi:hypothetical protein
MGTAFRGTGTHQCKRASQHHLVGVECRLDSWNLTNGGSISKNGMHQCEWMSRLERNTGQNWRIGEQVQHFEEWCHDLDITSTYSAR